ncbi:MAG: RNA-binding protein [Candidatus Hadarchaeaceae archaeon]
MLSRKRYRLRKDELKSIVQEANQRFGERISRVIGKDTEICEMDDGTRLIICGGKTVFFRKNDALFPTLKIVDLVEIKRVVVDMGAVPYIAKGADVMSPGIVKADPDIKAGDFVAIADERHGKTIAMGLAMVDGSVMKAPRGKAVQNIHHVGDRIWGALEKG